MMRYEVDIRIFTGNGPVRMCVKLCMSMYS